MVLVKRWIKSKGRIHIALHAGEVIKSFLLPRPNFICVSLLLFFY